MYKILNGRTTQVISKNNEDNTISFIPIDEANNDYQQYLVWVSEGNIAEEVSE